MRDALRSTASMLWNVSLLGVLGLLLLTVARRADLRQQKAHEALAASEERLRAFVAATPGISFLIDREGRYLEVSGREENLLAVPREHALGRTIAEIFEPRQAQEFMGLITAVLDSQQVATHITSWTLPERTTGSRRASRPRVVQIG